MTDIETATQLASVAAKLDAIHEDVRELKVDIIPNGQSRMAKIEKHVDRTIYGFGAVLVMLAALAGDRAYALLAVLP